MNYFFILGNNPSLSVAEILAYFKEKIRVLAWEKEVLLVSLDELDYKRAQADLGGTIKIGKVDGELRTVEARQVAVELSGSIEEAGSGKISFGVSYYGKNKINAKMVGMEIKRIFKEAGRSVRWVIGRDRALSSVIVEQNKLLASGGELVVLSLSGKTYYGRTLAIQPFKDLSFRDYGRPGRDDASGMLPPKLAKIMINLAGGTNMETRPLLIDPFCGSGTILTEASLMGYKNLVGADISDRAVADTKTNLEWTKEKYKLGGLHYELFHQGVDRLSKIVKAGDDKIIVMEPYLGPQKGGVKFEDTKVKLEKLYSDALLEFHKTLNKGERVVMVWPVFLKKIFLNPKQAGLRIIFPLPDELLKNPSAQLTARKTILYGRDDQRVWREIVILEK